MPNTKKFIGYDTTAKTVYGIIERQVDSYRLEDTVGADEGKFIVNPAKPYIAFTEHTIIKGEYVLSENRTVWDDGLYKCTMYEQLVAGEGNENPTNDMVIAYQYMQIKSDIEVDVGIADLANINAECDTANTAYGANKIAPNVVIPDVAGTVAGLLNTKIPTALTFTGSDVKATLDGEEVTPTVASKTGYALSVAGILAIWNQLTTDVGIIAGSFAKKLADWVILTSQSIRDAMKLAPTAGDPDVGSVDKHLDDILTNTALTGASHITLTFLKTATTIPLEGVSVTVRNSTDTMTKGIVVTDADGIAEFNIANDTYIFRPTMVGYLFDSITLIVSGDTEETYYGDARIPTPAPDPDIQTLTMTIRDLSGNPVINCLVQAVPTKRQIVNDTVIGLLKMTETTNTNGYAELFVEKLSEISVTAGADGEHLDMIITVTSDDDRDISDYV
jgi:hypothetical protein